MGTLRSRAPLGGLASYRPTYLVDEQGSQRGVGLIQPDGSAHRRLTAQPLAIPGEVYDFAAAARPWQPRE
jgi:hypothetical protein